MVSQMENEGVRVTFRDSVSSRLTINRHRNITLNSPLASFAPNAHSGFQSPQSRQEKRRANTRHFSWLGLVDVFQEESLFKCGSMASFTF